MLHASEGAMTALMTVLYLVIFVCVSLIIIITPTQYCGQFVCLCICLSTSISLEPLDQSSRNCLCISPVAVAQSFSGGFTTCNVLPVLWITSRLTVVGHMAMRGRLNL